MNRAWREANRNYGVRVPPHEVELALLNGWELIVDPDDRDPSPLMRPPEPDRSSLQEAHRHAA
jgi:hypothetical protein